VHQASLVESRAEPCSRSIVCSQNPSGCSICWFLTSIAMSGLNMVQQTVSVQSLKYQSLSNWQVHLYGIFMVQNVGLLKLAVLFGWTPQTCLKPAVLG